MKAYEMLTLAVSLCLFLALPFLGQQLRCSSRSPGVRRGAAFVQLTVGGIWLSDEQGGTVASAGEQSWPSLLAVWVTTTGSFCSLLPQGNASPPDPHPCYLFCPEGPQRSCALFLNWITQSIKLHLFQEILVLNLNES